MRVLVCRSRDWFHYDLVGLILDLFQASQEELIIITGGCRGVDTFAYDWAINKKIPTLLFPADWTQGKSGGPKRNQRMLTEGSPDFVLAFTDDLNASRGTHHMVTIAEKKGIPVKVYSSEEIRILLSLDLATL